MSLDPKIYDVQAKLMADSSINPAYIRIWDQSFELWKNRGFPMNSPEVAEIPKAHPLSDHPWNESKEKYVELLGFNPKFLQPDNGEDLPEDEY